MGAWLAEQIERFGTLEGLQIDGWSGVEMALAEREDGNHLWRDDRVPFLQLLTLRCSAGDQSFLITTAQNDDTWGLCIEATPASNYEAEPRSIYRQRDVPGLPSGIAGKPLIEVTCGNIASVRLQVGRRLLRLIAGEVYQDADDVLTIRFEDESVLAQVDGEHPDLEV